MSKLLDRRRQLASLLRDQTNSILLEWEDTVRSSVSADKTLNRSALRNSLRLLIKSLADALEDATQADRVARALPIARRHAKHRVSLQKHRCGQLVAEYAELRQAVINHVGYDKLLHGNSLQLIIKFFDAAIAQSVDLFDGLRQKQEKQQRRDEMQRCQEQKQAAEQERDDCWARTGELQEESQLRSQIAAMVGHDMRAPLAAALLTAQQLVKRVGGVPMGPERLERIMGAIERLGTMVQAFLDADQLRSGQPVAIATAVCDLAKVFGAAYRDLATVHGDRFIVDFPRRLSALADAAALERVLANLASNAVKYGREGTPILLRLEKQGAQAVLSVHNDGHPVDSLLLPRLFEPRYRSGHSSHATRGGWGLGLASVKAITEAHGGSVDVRSAPEEGTTFFVRIPLGLVAGHYASTAVD